MWQYITLEHVSAEWKLFGRMIDWPHIVFAGSLQIAMHVQDGSTKKEIRQKHKSLNKCFWRGACVTFFLKLSSLTKKKYYSTYLRVYLWSPTFFSVCIFLSTSVSWLTHFIFLTCLCVFSTWPIPCLSHFSDWMNPLHLSSDVGFPSLLVADSFLFYCPLVDLCIVPWLTCIHWKANIPISGYTYVYPWPTHTHTQS